MRAEVNNNIALKFTYCSVCVICTLIRLTLCEHTNTHTELYWKQFLVKDFNQTFSQRRACDHFCLSNPSELHHLLVQYVPCVPCKSIEFNWSFGERTFMFWLSVTFFFSYLLFAHGWFAIRFPCLICYSFIGANEGLSGEVWLICWHA